MDKARNVVPTRCLWSGNRTAGGDTRSPDGIAGRCLGRKVSSQRPRTTLPRSGEIDDARKYSRVVAFSGREYRIGNTIDLPTGIHLVGAAAAIDLTVYVLDGPTPLLLDSCMLCQKAAGVTVRGYVRRGHTTETNV